MLLGLVLALIAVTAAGLVARTHFHVHVITETDDMSNILQRLDDLETLTKSQASTIADQASTIADLTSKLNGSTDTASAVATLSARVDTIDSEIGASSVAVAGPVDAAPVDSAPVADPTQTVG